MQEKKLLDDMLKRQENKLYYYDFGTGIKIPTESTKKEYPFLQDNVVKSEANPKAEEVKKWGPPIEKAFFDDTYGSPTYTPKKRDSFLEGFNEGVWNEEKPFTRTSKILSDFDANLQSNIRKREYASNIPEIRLGGDIDSDEEYEDFIETFKAEGQERDPIIARRYETQSKAGKGKAFTEEEKLNLREKKRSIDYSMRPEELLRRANETKAQFLPKYESKAQFLPEYEPKAQFLPKYESKAQFLPKYENSEYPQDMDTEENYRDATLWDLTVNSAKREYYDYLYGEELYKQMLGKKNEADKYEEILSGEAFRFENDGVLEAYLSNISGKGGELWSKMNDNEIINAAIAGGGTGALLAVTAGQAGPQLALPEEALTVPGAFLAGAIKTAGPAISVSDNRVNTGHMYKKLLDEGVSASTARDFALGTHVINSVISLVPVDDILKSLKVFSKIKGANETVNTLCEELISRGVDYAKEETQSYIREKGIEAAKEKSSKR